MPLTDTGIKNTKPTGKALKLFDGGGLFLHVAPNGGKWWRLKYRFGGKEKLISLGTYPAISLKDARQRREEAKELLAQGVDPGEEKKAVKAAIIATQQEAANTFEAVAREWYSKYSVTLEPKHQQKILSRLEKMLFPDLGSLPIRNMEAPDLLVPIRKVEEAGKIETAHRLTQLCSHVFRYAVITKKPSTILPPTLKAHCRPQHHNTGPALPTPSGLATSCRQHTHCIQLR